MIESEEEKVNTFIRNFLYPKLRYEAKIKEKQKNQRKAKKSMHWTTT